MVRVVHPILDPSQSDPSPNYRIGSRISPNRALQNCQSLLRCPSTAPFSLQSVETEQNEWEMFRFGKLNSLLNARFAITLFLGPSEMRRLPRLKRSKLKP